MTQQQIDIIKDIEIIALDIAGGAYDEEIVQQMAREVLAKLKELKDTY